MQVNLNYKDYSANFENNILNIYSNKNKDKLISSKAYSDIIYKNEIKNIFEDIVDIKLI